MAPAVTLCRTSPQTARLLHSQINYPPNVLDVWVSRFVSPRVSLLAVDAFYECSASLSPYPYSGNICDGSPLGAQPLSVVVPPNSTRILTYTAFATPHTGAQLFQLVSFQLFNPQTAVIANVANTSPYGSVSAFALLENPTATAKSYAIKARAIMSGAANVAPATYSASFVLSLAHSVGTIVGAPCGLSMPRIAVAGDAVAGGKLDIAVSALAPGMSGVVLVSHGLGSVPIGTSCSLLLDPTTVSLVDVVSLPALVAGAGTSYSIPATATSGSTLTFQVLLLDPAVMPNPRVSFLLAALPSARPRAWNVFAHALLGASQAVSIAVQ